MRTVLALFFAFCAAAAFAQEVPAAGSTAATETTAVPDAAAAPASADEGIATLQAEIERLGASLDEANTIIDELRAEAWDLKDKARAAEARAAEAEGALAEAQAAAEAANSDLEAATAELEAAQAEAQTARAEAATLRSKVADLEARIAGLEAGRGAAVATAAAWGSLRLDKALFPTVLRSGFEGAKVRLGSWRIEGGVATQTDPKQYFSRLTFPVEQGSAPTLYSFETRTGAEGWSGTGIHFFAENVKRPRGYGEGRSLLLWLTRDEKARGGRETYLQLYRSADDVNMERVMDARIAERVASWLRVDVLYDPKTQFIVAAVNGEVKAAYRAFFGIDEGISVSLRSLGEGVSFRGFEVRR